MDEKDLYELKKFCWFGKDIKKIKEEYNRNQLFRNSVDFINHMIKEPRYSVEELTKIFNKLVGPTHTYEWDVDYFLEFLKDKKQVGEILTCRK